MVKIIFRKFSYTVSLLQTLGSILSETEQKNMISSIISDSSLLQEKLFLNLCKLPILIKIIPISSDTKFDIIRNHSKNISDKSQTEKSSYANNDVETKQINKENSSESLEKIFLYNPWEKDKNVNYYWTSESSQRVLVQFYNPLAIELRVNKIVLLFEGNKPFSFPSKNN